MFIVRILSPAPRRRSYETETIQRKIHQEMELVSEACTNTRVKICSSLTQVQSLIPFLTNILTTGKTRITALAAISNPRDTYTISYFQRLHRAAYLANDANSFVSKHNWIVSDPPVVVTHVNISVTQAVLSGKGTRKRRRRMQQKACTGD